MRNDDTPMWDDPNEPAFVRELLKSGRQNPVAYDVERGLSEHLARIAAGAAAPPWAEVGAVAKSAVPAWVGYVIVPLAAAGIAGLAWIFTGQSVTPKPAESPSAAAVAAVGTPALGSDSAGSAPAIEAAAASADSAARAARAPQPPQPPQPPRPPRPQAEPAGPEPSSRSARASRAHGRSAKALATGSDSVASSAMSTSADSAESGQDNSAQTGRADSSAATGRPVPEAQSQRPSHASETLAAPQPEAAERREPDERPARAPMPARDAAQAKTDSVPVPVPVIDEARLEREMQMLAVTQRVLAANPARALRLSQQGEREFPNTMFSGERRQLGLLALVKLGRLDEARRVGQPFLAKYPNAPWSERLRRALASGVVD